MKLIIDIRNIAFTALISALFLAFALAANAQEYRSGDVQFSTGATVAPTANVTAPATKPPLGQIRANIENRIEANSGIRNAALVRLQERASTTVMFKRMSDMRHEMIMKMEFNRFEFRRNALLRELQVTLRNLDNISVRIDSRIAKMEASGTVMTESRNLLSTANGKLAAAKELVITFQNMTPPSKITASGTTTAEVEVAKPRIAGDAAIQAVKDARDAFKKVVASIALSTEARGEVNISQ